MKTRKKLLIALLSATCLTAGAFGLAACDEETKDPALVGIYNAYVTEANEKNETPLSYEEWLKDKLGSVAEKGEQGKPGDPGQPGANGKSAYELYQEAVYAADPNATPMTQAQWLASLNGITPHVGENGNWYIGTENTGVKAAGTDGTNGVGVTGVTMSEDGKSLVVSFTSGEPATVALPDYVTHKHTYGKEYTVVIPATGDTDGIGYKVCSGEGCEHIELVTIGAYSYKITVYLSDIQYGEDGIQKGTAAADAKVTIKNGNGEKVAEATTDAKGEAIFNDIEKGEYTVVVEKDGYVAMNPEEPEEDEEFIRPIVTSKNASDYAMVLVKSFTRTGEDDHTTGDLNHAYQITTEFDNETFLFDSLVTYQMGQNAGYHVATTYIDFTAPESGVYNFMSMCVNICGIPAPVNGESELSVVLAKGEKYRIAVAIASSGDYDTYYTDAQLSKFALTVLRGKSLKGKEGTEACPVAADTNGKTTYTARANEEVYFKITASAGMSAKYKFTFDAQNVGIFALGSNIESMGNVLESGNYIDFGVREVYYSTTYYFVASAKDGNIEFTAEAYYLEGEKGKPIAVTLGNEYNTSNTGFDEVWYKLDVATAGKLTLERTSEDVREFRIYKDVNAEAAEAVVSADINPYEFDAGTYYIFISGACTFKVRAYNSQTDAGNSADDPVTLEAGEKYGIQAEYKYLKFVADKAGKFAVNAYGGSASVSVYSDAAFETENKDYDTNKYLEVKAGDVLYVRANTYNKGTKISFTVVSETDKVDYLINVVVGNGATPPPVEGAVVTVKDAEGTPVEGVSATTDADGLATLNLLPGNYTIVIDLTNVDGNYAYNGTATLTTSYGATTTTVNLAQLYSYSYTVSFDGAGIPNLTFTYDGEEYITDADGKVTVWAAGTPHYYGQFDFANTEYDGYTLSYALADPDDDYSYVLTLKAPAAPVTYSDLGRISETEYSFNVTERKGYTFVAAAAAFEVYITVEGGYIEYLKENTSEFIKDGNISDTFYGNDYTFGSESYTIIIVPTDEENGATVTIETVLG